MSQVISASNPLSYVGVKEKNPPEIWKASRAPIDSDYRYDVGDLWLDEANDDAYIMTSKSGAVAVWIQIGDLTGLLHTLNGDAGSATPTANAMTLAGGTNITTSAAASTVTIDLDDDITVGDVRVYSSLLLNSGGSTSSLSFNGMRVISGTATTLASGTDFSITNSGAYGVATLYLNGINDTDVPAAVYHLSKRTATTAANIVSASQDAGAAGAVYTVTWPTIGTTTVNFQHNVGVGKSIYYRLVY